MKKKIKLLLVEDDPNLGTLLKDYLDAKGHQCILRTNGEDGYKSFTNEAFDFVILDVMMPVKDGFSLAKDIRGIDQKVPILFLTAKSLSEDKLKGFETGADDYMTKPFSMEELMARITAILRRSSANLNQDDSKFTIGDFSFDTKLQILKSDNENQKLTTKESDLLKLLCKNENAVLERNHALKAVWGDDNYFNGRSMDVYIAKLRKYLKSDQRIQIINVHGKGFKLLITKN
ncbi:MAG: DNA-binding response regulator [Crocinitomicaceae bacterium]|nr:DNA-binding response regulator [Crocinitomicaceae bacterium]|tara:strand:+ start:239 stop:934 length:696 start_codon:yes stop_codon:yes gene_type:complete